VLPEAASTLNGPAPQNATANQAGSGRVAAHVGDRTSSVDTITTRSKASASAKSGRGLARARALRISASLAARSGAARRSLAW